MDFGTHWFWHLLSIACIVWYSTVTILVAFKGGSDIKAMTARLKGLQVSDTRDRAPDKFVR